MREVEKNLDFAETAGKVNSRIAIKFTINMYNLGWISGQVQFDTWKWFAAIWVIRLYFIPICTKALVGPICIDAVLATGKPWRAFINVYTCFTIILHLESRPAFALGKEKMNLINSYHYQCLFMIRYPFSMTQTRSP